jgi:hypothetical protein
MTDERLSYLVFGWLDRQLSVEERGELETFLLSGLESRQRFWRLAAFDSSLADAAKLVWSEPAPVTADAAWFIQEVPLAEKTPGQALPPAPQNPPTPESLPLFSSLIAPTWMKWSLATAALIALVSLAIIGLRGPGKPAAELLAAAHPRWTDGESIALGAGLPNGKPLRLESGAIELKFNSGASVIVCGPADVQLVDGGRLALRHGEVTARVPPQAIGFTVAAPGLVITDLGTEFAASIGASGQAQVTVLEGRVEVEAPADALGARQRLALGNGESVARGAQSERLTPTAAPPIDAIPRTIAKVRAPFPLLNTGVGLKADDPDPSWQVTSVPDDPNHAATAAVVMDMRPSDHLANDPAEAQWLSPAPRNVPEGLYMYEYKFDLPAEFDPASVVVRMQLMADNAVRRVLVNGHATGWRTTPQQDSAAKFKYAEMSLDADFVAGRNRIEFEVENIKFSQMGLRVILKGSGCLTVRRAGDK